MFFELNYKYFYIFFTKLMVTTKFNLNQYIN